MRREYVAVLVVCILLGGAWGGWMALFGEPPEATVAILDVRGGVRVTGAAGEGPAEVGQQVHAKDRLAAGPDGRAVLGLGGEARLTLEPDTRIEVVSVEDAGVTVELDEGRVSATVRPGGRRLAVGADGREVRAEDADFTVARALDGTLALAAERGVVTTNLPGAETIGAGQKVVAPRDRQALVAPASAALLLQVAWPEQTRTRSDGVVVSGTTEPGARVILDAVGGPVVVQAGADGTFRADVALREGENEVKIHATSALGQVADVSWHVVRDTEAPPIQVDLRP